MERYSRYVLLTHKQAQQRSASQRQHYATLEQEDPECWPIYDSPLLPTGRKYDTTSYQETFAKTLPEGQPSLQSYIEGLKAAKVVRTGNPHVSFKGLDLFGQGTRLFSEFTSGTFTQTAANSLNDLRTDAQRATDVAINNTFIPGDYYNPFIREQIKSTIGQKVDVLFLKAIGGADTIPPNPFLIARQIQPLWDMLEDEGVMFVQVPTQVRALVQPWLDKIMQTGAVEGKWARHKYLGYFLRLTRHAGAPEQLPLLSRREVFDALQTQVA